MRWFTSDLHLDHNNILYYSKRPFGDLSHQAYEIIGRFNEVIAHSDTVYFLGDTFFSKGQGQEIRWFRKLNGHKILIQGNHDGPKTLEKARLAGYDDFIGISVNPVISIEGRAFTLSHFPFCPVHVKPVRTFNSRITVEPTPDNWLICGHVHEKWKKMRCMLNVGVDQWNFYPVSETTILEETQAIGGDYSIEEVFY